MQGGEALVFGARQGGGIGIPLMAPDMDIGLELLDHGSGDLVRLGGLFGAVIAGQAGDPYREPDAVLARPP